VIVNLFSDDEIIISLNKEIKKKRKRKPKVVLDELKVGDYIVHDQYGVGLFEGLSQVRIMGGMRDFVSIAYAGEDKLLLPVENLHLIDRYVGDSGNIPLIDKLGKGSFQKLKSKVKKRLFEIANEIIKRAAERQLIEAKTIKHEITELQDFVYGAGFEYTADQVTSISEIRSDMLSGQVMDRLLSGDVGFGKTEVAMNALFMAVKSGLQAAIVVPTTLLSNQHYNSVLERFEKYNITVAKIDRFTTTKEKKSFILGLKNGEYQVAVGTHALMSVDFQDLGLMIIDEEHKFGVKQKEKLKEKAKNLHLLSMSATPIPRSLNMALSSLKGYSQLLTPPSEREDVRTYVREYNEKMLKEAVHRELKRGGQLFYVFNKIATIEQKRKKIEELLPNIRILVLHSQIPPLTAEKQLLKFANKEYDLLLATTIIESGIHMPNVNTIMIDGANNFGIADLHQLRGRVGRGSRQGFCYYLIEDKDMLTDDAKKRLMALESNSFLGSGAVLAYHDLEIRGGGNLIGEAQSGHIKNIGYSLYLKMLEEAINQLSNKSEETVHNEVTEIKLAISAFISQQVISEDKLRLEIYRRLALCKTPSAAYELEAEMIDRFGTLDAHTKSFIEMIVIKLLATNKKIKTISNYNQNITLIYHNEKKESFSARSKDDDDIISALLEHLHKK
jgi:transcription-repair coupling factor (superfamily II helicase)